jgi:hypothetical protein
MLSPPTALPALLVAMTLTENWKRASIAVAVVAMVVLLAVVVVHDHPVAIQRHSQPI